MVPDRHLFYIRGQKKTGDDFFRVSKIYVRNYETTINVCGFCTKIRQDEKLLKTERISKSKYENKFKKN